VLTTHILLVPDWEWVGAIPQPPLCAFDIFLWIGNFIKTIKTRQISAFVCNESYKNSLQEPSYLSYQIVTQINGGFKSIVTLYNPTAGGSAGVLTVYLNRKYFT
jgi:hypothetical protein